jgi:curved DNA-binding protein CbpA
MSNTFNKLNLYEILEINENADNNIIKQSYRKLSLKYHPDKINNLNNDLINDLNNKENINDKFIKIKYAYDILIDPLTRKKYDMNRNINRLDDYFNFDQLFDGFKLFFNSNEHTNLIKIAENKLCNSLSNDNKFIVKFINEIKNFNIINIINIIRDVKTTKLLDIEIFVDFSIYEIYNNFPKNITYNRITKNTFDSIIFPINKEQMYKGDGESLNINSTCYTGDIVIQINILNNTHNNVIYYILNNDLYINIKNENIIDDIISLNYLDNINYNFNLNDLNKSITDFGSLYCVEHFGLPVNDLNPFNMELNKQGVKRGNLFFIILI